MEDFNGMEELGKPKMVVLAGPNGSGKSTVTRGLRQSEEFPHNYINADDITKTLEAPVADRATRDRYAAIIEPNMPDLPWYAQIAKLEKRLTQEEVGGYLAGGVERTDLRNAFGAILADDQRKQALAGHGDFAFETVMSTQGKLAMFDEARNKGYDVDMVFVTTESSLINRQRVLNRVQEGGHAVEPEKIVERYNRAMGMLPAALGMVDTASVYDNSYSHPVLVATKQNGVITFPELQAPKYEHDPTKPGSRDLAEWSHKEEWDSQLRDMSQWVKEKIQAPVEARQASMDSLKDTHKNIEHASIEDKSATHGRIVLINDVHVLQYDREREKFVVHDRSLLTPGVIPALESARDSGKDVNIAYEYGPDSKLVDQNKALHQTPELTQASLDKYMFDPSSREEPKPRHI